MGYKYFLNFLKLSKCSDMFGNHCSMLLSENLFFQFEGWLHLLLPIHLILFLPYFVLSVNSFNLLIYFLFTLLRMGLLLLFLSELICKYIYFEFLTFISNKAKNIDISHINKSLQDFKNVMKSWAPKVWTWCYFPN